ncbi:MAG: hypothetical protein CMN84_09165 [Spongiibacteraceae bacterium]|jgi:glycosyltransferase involved in cell wall biosynthesis|nr:hypothetical protein [Spongiibacteraceae bacterium]
MTDMVRPDPPLLSVIIPSYNQGQFLKQAIDSILEQDYRPIEVIVVDGASSDDTVEVLRNYSGYDEVSWISEPDRGPADAVNKGLARAKGRYASIQSADDYYLPGAFAKAIRVFQSNPNVGLLYGEVASVDVAGQVMSVSSRPPHDNALCIALCICIPQCSAFFDTNVARELGGWSDQYHTADWALWLRMLFKVETVKIDDTLSCWRVYQGQRTDQREKVYSSYKRMVDESVEINQSGFRVRMAALASKHLIALSFAPERGRYRKLLSLCLAIVLFPPAFRWIPGKRRFVPGLQRFGRLITSKSTG